MPCLPGGVDIVSDGVLHDNIVHVGGRLEVCFFPLVPVIGWAWHPARRPHAPPGGRNWGRPCHNSVGLYDFYRNACNLLLKGVAEYLRGSTGGTDTLRLKQAETFLWNLFLFCSSHIYQFLEHGEELRRTGEFWVLLSKCVIILRQVIRPVELWQIWLVEACNVAVIRHPPSSPLTSSQLTFVLFSSSLIESIHRDDSYLVNFCIKL